jgi:hypothetical protein
LLNVVRGEMSLVGPRPLLVEFTTDRHTVVRARSGARRHPGGVVVDDVPAAIVRSREPNEPCLQPTRSEQAHRAL